MKTLLAWLFSTSFAFAQLGPGAGVPVGPGASSGGGGGGGSGTVTSIATGCQATGGTITTTGTISTQQTSVAHVTGDTILTGECGELGTYNSGSAVAITLPQAGSAGFAAGWYEDHTNYGAGTVTFTTSTSTFLSNGTPSTYAITQGQGVRFTASTASPGNWEVSNVGVGQSLATPITGANGGTGVANTGKTVTLGASLTTTGAGAATFAFPGTAQIYTLPAATDTLAGLGTIQTFSAAQTFSGAVNFTSTFSVGGNAITWPAAAITVARTDAAQTFTGTQTFAGAVTGNLTVSAASGFLQSTFSGATVIGAQYRNTGTANGAAILAEFGNNSSASEVTMLLNGAATSTGNGTSSFTINNIEAANTGGIYLQTQGTNAVTISKAQLVAFPAITSDATHTDSTVCQDSTTHALYAGSGTIGICLGTSSARYKNNIVNLSDGLRELMLLNPKNFFYNNDRGDYGAREQYGFLAEDVVDILPKLVGMDAENKPNSVDILGMVPILVKAMQEQQAQIDALKILVQERRAGLQ